MSAGEKYIWLKAHSGMQNRKHSRRGTGWRLLGGFILALVFAGASGAEVRLPGIFADHMVVQRDRLIHLWGMAEPNERVTVQFRDETQSTIAGAFGQWSVYLGAQDAGGPYVLTVKGSNEITYHDVLVGDVWIASGQSNMAFPMVHGDNRGVIREEAEVRAANFPRIRLLNLALRSSEYPLADVAVRHPWAACTPETVASFSAVAYFFARDLQPHAKVPIGMIDASWGGSPAEAWLSLDAIASNSSLMPVIARRAHLMDGWENLLLLEKKEKQEIAAATAAGKPAPQFWHMDLASWRPAGLFNAMIAPITPFSIKGVLWYQAESNADADAVPIYGELFRALIRDWRRAWAQDDLPFLFVQLPNFDSGDTWPELREQQAQALELKDTAMVVTIDIGDAHDIHPKNKQDVGARLALAARALAYGEQIESSGPQLRQVEPEADVLRLSFTHVHRQLKSSGGSLRGFEVAGADQKFEPAQARIAGNTVIISSAAVRQPAYVRYCWAPNPDCNLYNDAGLPAAPFRAAVFLRSNPVPE